MKNKILYGKSTGTIMALLFIVPTLAIALLLSNWIILDASMITLYQVIFWISVMKLYSVLQK